MDLSTKRCKPHGNRKFSPEISAYRAKVANYKSHAKRRDIEWALPMELASDLLQGDCYYCGSPPERVFKYGDWMRRKWPQYRNQTIDVRWNGIDRIDNSVGYLPDNVVTCCWTCNDAKSDRHHDEFITWIHRIAKRVPCQD